MDTDQNVHATRSDTVGIDPYAAPAVPVVPAAPAVTWISKVHWGAVWAGLLTAVPTFLVLQVFFYWVGALSLTMRHNALGLGTTNEWLSPLLGIVAFFIGGWVATQNMPDTRPSAGILNGFLVWALGISFIVALSTMGIGLAFGSAGGFFDQFLVSSRGAIPGGTNGLDLFAFRDAAGWGLLFLVLSAIFSMIGGSIGCTLNGRRLTTPVR